MKIGCLINLAIYGILVGAYYWWVSRTLDPPEVWIVSCIAALLAAGACGALYNSWLARRDVAVLRQAEGHLRPQGERWTAVAGTLEPQGEALLAPFSGEPCLICEYQIGRDTNASDDNDGTASKRGVDFAGIAMADCAVRTASGDVPLFGFPDMKNVPERALHSEKARYRAHQYVHATEWTDCSGLKVFGGVGDMWHALKDAESSQRHDWRLIGADKCVWLASPPPPELEGYVTEALPVVDEFDKDLDDQDLDDFEDFDDFDEEDRDDNELASGEDAVAGGEGHSQRSPLEEAYWQWKRGYDGVPSEKRFAAGEQVVAIGFYDAVRGGLTSSVSRNGQMLRLFRGDAKSVAAELGGSKRRLFWGGLVALVMINAALYGGLTLYRNSEETQSRLRRELDEAVRKPDAARVRRLLERGAPVDGRDSAGRTVLMDAGDAEVVRLLVAHGADVDAVDNEGETALMRAAQNNRPAAIQALIESGANLDLASTRYGKTALMSAINAENRECAELLRKAGAKDDTVTAANGTPITAADEPFTVCAAYIRAIFAADSARLVELSSPRRGITFDEVDWKAWQGARPVEPQLVEGFVRGDDATVAVTGMAPEGFRSVWVFQLRREQGEWHVLRERWAVKGL